MDNAQLFDLEPLPKPETAPSIIYAAHDWASNSELILDVHRLGYLKDEDYTLDPTYGLGNWWKLWRPLALVTSDIKTGTDFRHLPHAAETFDAVAYDPPYIAQGPTKHAGTQDIKDRYGLALVSQKPIEVQELINAGASECCRVLKKGGVLLVKCQDYIKNGKYFAGTHHTLNHVLDVGLEIVDRLEHIAGPRPQPKGVRQVHARRNLSTLLIFRKGKR